MMGDFWWLAILSRTHVRRPRWFVPLIIISIIGVIIAGVVYASIVFQAASERNNNPHVHAHSTH